MVKIHDELSVWMKYDLTVPAPTVRPYLPLIDAISLGPQDKE